MYLGDPGRTSVGSYYEIWKDGKKYADGAAKIVWIDIASGRSVPLPDAVAAPLRALEPGRPAAAGNTAADRM
jgi:acyl-CoA thioester hydrolase